MSTLLYSSFPGKLGKRCTTKNLGQGMHQLQVSGVWCILSYWWDHSACWARAGAWACTVLLGIPLWCCPGWCCPGLACTEHHTVAADKKLWHEIKNCVQGSKLSAWQWQPGVSWSDNVMLWSPSGLVSDLSCRPSLGFNVRYLHPTNYQLDTTGWLGLQSIIDF